MINIKLTQNDLKILFNDQEKLVFIKGQKILDVGDGQTSFSMSRGSFTIKEKVFFKEALIVERFEETKDGAIIRLKGQGPLNPMTGAKGDLRLKLHVASDQNFTVEGDNLVTQVLLTPWEAVLGAKVDVKTMTGKVKLSIPAGTQNGSRLRLRQKGMPLSNGGFGDLFAEVKIMIPKTVSDAEKEVWQKLASASEFNPRG